MPCFHCRLLRIRGMVISEKNKNQERKVIKMSDYQKQKAVKPEVEAVAAEILEGDELNSLLDFVRFLRDNKLTPRWASSNSWTIRYKNKGLCYIKIDSRKRLWNARPERSFFDEYDKYITDIDLKAFILEIVNPPLCENRDCWKRREEAIFGKKFTEVCRCWPFKVDNPEGVVLERLKELILVSKNIIIELTAANKA